LAYEAAESGLLPENFDRCDLANNLGVTVADTAIKNGQNYKTVKPEKTEVLKRRVWRRDFQIGVSLKALRDLGDLRQILAYLLAKLFNPGPK
jgi:hypothetical protein